MKNSIKNAINTITGFFGIYGKIMKAKASGSAVDSFRNNFPERGLVQLRIGIPTSGFKKDKLKR